MAKGVKTGGRKPGSVNKATKEFRDTVTRLLSDNAENVATWLAEVAEGIPPVITESGEVAQKGVPADPGKALDLLAKLAEYAAPKLGRTEHVGDGGGAIDHSLTVNFVGAK
jgi:antitoxin (DNA-binding transcriptional repressor) of toxin-antitoxin stability system